MEVDFTSVNLDFKLRDGGLQSACKWTPETEIYKKLSDYEKNEKSYSSDVQVCYEV